MSDGLRIGIACGGTGGHIYPGLATAEVLAQRGHEVTLWLSGRRVEETVVTSTSCRVERIAAVGLPSGISLESLAAGCGLLRAAWQCRQRMRRHRCDVLLGMGSYASVGPVLAARTLRVPVVLHESNAVPGRAVALLSRFAALIAVNFEESARALGHHHWVRTGMPVRAGLRDAEPLWPHDPDALTVLIMGGSQGAHRVNELATEALCALHRQGTAVRVIHLTGSDDEAWVRETYRAAGVPAKVHAFLKEMGRALMAADVAVVRAGSATCAELAVCGLPAIFIPYPAAARDHQSANAHALADGGGAIVAPQPDLTVDSLQAYIRGIGDDPARRHRMGESMRRMAMEDGAARLADVVERAANAGRGGTPREE